MKPILKKYYLAIIVAVLIFGLFQTVTLAQETSTVTFSYIGEGIEFKLYKVGDISSNGVYSLSGAFSDYSVSLEDSNAPITLAAYALRDGISPDAISITNSEYNVVFNGLSRGVYLITGEGYYVMGGKRYTASPVLVSVTNDKDDRDIFIVGKYEAKDINPPTDRGGGSPSDGVIEISVLKVWKNSTSKSDVTVQLLRDGIVDNEVILTSRNNWRNTWTGLSDDYNWTVVEKEVAEEYEVSIEKDGSVFVITNTFIPTEPEETETPNKENTTESPSSSENPETPNTPNTFDTPDTPDVSDSGTPGDTPDSESASDNYDSPNEDIAVNIDNKFNKPPNTTDAPNGADANKHGLIREKLPQTGQLWWPVPIFACIGILFLIIGMGYRRKEDCYECE